MCYDFVFFFKQKTAYEMRISDWSSDVCSSDLKFHVWSVRSIEEAIELFTGLPAGVPDRRGNYPSDTVYGRVMDQIGAFDAILKERGDRKSVVLGKSGAVRLDLGGRSRIKKKKK